MLRLRQEDHVGRGNDLVAGEEQAHQRAIHRLDVVVPGDRRDGNKSRGQPGPGADQRLARRGLASCWTDIDARKGFGGGRERSAPQQRLLAAQDGGAADWNHSPGDYPRGLADGQHPGVGPVVHTRVDQVPAAGSADGVPVHGRGGAVRERIAGNQIGCQYPSDGFPERERGGGALQRRAGGVRLLPGRGPAQ